MKLIPLDLLRDHADLARVSGTLQGLNDSNKTVLDTPRDLTTVDALAKLGADYYTLYNTMLKGVLREADKRNFKPGGEEPSPEPPPKSAA